MKNTSVTPSATFDQMPRPNHSVKIGASTTRGSALIIFTYGSNTAATRGCWANQKPIKTPATEPMTKASIASINVIHRCFQIVPSANHLTTRAATSTGFEKKNGGNSVTPPIGTVVRTYHDTTEMTAMRTCNERSLILDMDQAPLVAHSLRLERVLEQPDDARRSLDVAGKLLEQLQPGEARRQCLGVEIGRDQDEGVVVR